MFQYSFETEEGVLQWAQERERQLEVQRQIQEENKLAKQLEEQSKISKQKAESSESEPEDEWLSNQTSSQSDNSNSQSQPVTRPVPPPRPKPPIQPRLTTNKILTPTPINHQIDQTQPKDINLSVDVTLFEQEDDPFDRYERQTLNELEELKNVFSMSNSNANSSEQTQNVDNDEEDDGRQTYENITNATPAYENVTEPVPNYENVSDLRVNLPAADVNTNTAAVSYNASGQPTVANEDNNDYMQRSSQTNPSSEPSSQVDLSTLPSINQSKNFLVGKIPLPPIGNSPRQFTKRGIDNDRQNTTHNSSENVYANPSNELPLYENVSIDSNSSAVSFSMNKYMHNHTSDTQTERQSRQSRVPQPNDISISVAGASNSVDPPPLYENVFSTPSHHIALRDSSETTVLRNALSSPNISTSSTNPWGEYDNTVNTNVPAVLLSKTPPPRPSSNQVSCLTSYLCTYQIGNGADKRQENTLEKSLEFFAYYSVYLKT